MARERCQGPARAAGAVYAHAHRAGGINSTLDEATRATLPYRVQHICCTPAYPARGGSGQSPGGDSSVQLHFTIGEKIYFFQKYPTK